MNSKYLFTYLSFFFCVSSYGQKFSLPQLIEKAGKQKVLCEQITKSYLMMGSSIKTVEARSEFDDSKFAFSKNMLYLSEYSKLQETKNAIQNVVVLWNEFKTTIESVPTRENAIIVMYQSEVLLKNCNEMISKIYLEHNLKNTRLINLCNRQRLNVQKIAKHWICNKWKINSLDFEKNINEALTSYEFSLSQLMADKSQPEIYKLLTQQQSDWSGYKSNFVFENKTVEPETVIEKTTLILNEWNKLAVLYQKMAIVSN